MPVEFISSTNFGPSTGVKYSGFDPAYARRYIRMLDDGGFDWTLVGYDSQRVDSVTRAQFILNHSERIKPVVAHRPGFQFPTQFAKAIAGLDRIGGGRLAIHIIAGGSDAEMRREGDYTTKEERYRRAEEFIEIVRRIWTQDSPISHSGELYAFEDFHTDIKPVQEALAISVGGSSQQAYDVGGRQGDIFGLWGEPLKETVAQALIDYAEIGCDLLSIRGWDVYEDAQDYARYVLPLVRQELAHREVTGTAPILNPDSTPELAASTP